MNKDFETFIRLLKTKDVHITLILRISRNGINVGKNAYKNMVFRIKKESINELFTEVYSFEN